MSVPVKVFAPATVSNVAVGFDVLGFAIGGVGDEVLIKKGNSPGLKITRITGGKLPYETEKNTAGFAALSLLRHLGLEEEPIEMEIRKKMPFATGMGSSGASAVAGAFGVSTYLKTGMEKRELLPFALEGEKLSSGSYHGDNVVPSMMGGMMIIRDIKTCDVKRVYVPEGLSVVVILPQVQVFTREARQILKKEILLTEHVEQSANLASFIAAMYTSDFDLIGRCLNDGLIEPQRKHLIPYFDELKALALEEGALGFSISGSGPAVFALCNNSYIGENILEKAKGFCRRKKLNAKFYYSPIDLEGAFKY